MATDQVIRRRRFCQNCSCQKSPRIDNTVSTQSRRSRRCTHMSCPSCCPSRRPVLWHMHGSTFFSRQTALRPVQRHQAHERLWCCPETRDRWTQIDPNTVIRSSSICPLCTTLLTLVGGSQDQHSVWSAAVSDEAATMPCKTVLRDVRCYHQYWLYAVQPQQWRSLHRTAPQNRQRREMRRPGRCRRCRMRQAWP